MRFYRLASDLVLACCRSSRCLRACSPANNVAAKKRPRARGWRSGASRAPRRPGAHRPQFRPSGKTDNLGGGAGPDYPGSGLRLATSPPRGCARDCWGHLGWPNRGQRGDVGVEFDAGGTRGGHGAGQLTLWAFQAGLEVSARARGATLGDGAKGSMSCPVTEAGIGVDVPYSAGQALGR